MNKYNKTDFQKIKNISKKYLSSDNRSHIHILTTLFYYFITLCGISFNNTYICGVSVLLNYLLRLRIFLIFHDLCHMSLFKNSKTNLLYAKNIEFLSLYTYEIWSETHNEHHNVHGDITKYDPANTTITLSEYKKYGALKKVIFNILRSPPIFFILVPCYLCKFKEITYLFKEYDHNIIYKYYIKYTFFMFMYYLLTDINKIYILLLIEYLSGLTGTMLFHLQHSVNIGYLKNQKNSIDKFNGNIEGASFLKIPKFLKYFFFGIEYHHLHHFSSRIPGYNLKSFHEELESLSLLKDKKEIGYLQSIKSLFHVFYNEETGRYESQYIFKLLGFEH